MRFQSLVHVASVAAALSPGRRIVVLGSSSLLASFPDLGEVDGPLETSYDADLLIEGVDAELAGVLQEAIGEGSLFAAKEGYHADALRPEVEETFPGGWESRLVPLKACTDVVCLDPHDLAVIKLQAGRPKDLALCASLLSAGLLQPRLIRQRLEETRLNDPARAAAGVRLGKAIELAKLKSN